MGLKCRGEVLQAGKHPGCRSRVFSGSMPNCFPQPCAEVSCELCLCRVLDPGLPGGVQAFCGQSSLEKTSNTVHLPGSSHLRSVLTPCSPALLATCYHLQCCHCKELLSRLKSHYLHLSIPEMVQEHPCWPCSWARGQMQGSPGLSTDLNPPVLQCSEEHNWAVGDCWSRRRS